MILLLLSWVLLYFITSILGFGLVRLSRTEQTSKVSQTELILVGLTCVVVLVEITSIFLPADIRVVGFLLLLAIGVNWRVNNRPVQVAVSALRRMLGQPFFWVLVGTVLVFSITQPASFDSGLYHIPAIRWYERYRAIPGLGNLHGRLAFNSSYFVTSSAFGFTSLVGQTLFPLNGFLLILFSTYITNRLTLPNSIPGFRLFQFLILGLVFYYLLYPVSSPTSDIWATLLPLFVFILWLDQTPEMNPVRFFLLIAIGLLCLTVKLGTLPLLLFLPILLLTQKHLITPRNSLALVAIGALIMTPWLIRNVILSGYLVYPFPAVDLFPVDWKIPLSAVHFEEDCVVFWARYHVDESHFDPAKLAWPPARWLAVWWHDQGSPATMYYYKLNRPLFVAACLSPVVMIIQGIRSGFRPARLWLAYAVAILGFAFWFSKAPEFRFGFAFIWTAALLPWVPLLGRLPLPMLGQSLKWVLGLYLIVLSAKMVYQKRPVTAQSFLKPNWLGYRQLQAEGVRYQPHPTKSGFVVLIPEKNTFEQRCYDQEQPCTPYFFDDLEPRGNHLEDGFRRRSMQEALSGKM